MKKFGMGATGLLIGTALASQVAAKDMNTLNDVNLQTDGKDSIVKVNPLLVRDNTRDLVDSTLNSKNYSLSVSPTGEDALNSNLKLTPWNNFQANLGITHNFNSEIKDDTIGSIEMRYLLSAVDAGLSVSFEKGSEFQKIMGTIVKGYEGGTIKLSVAQLNKLTSVYFGEVDRTFEETLNQTAIGVEVSHKLSGFINEIRFGVNYFNVGSKDLGKIGTDIFETTNDITTTDYYGAIQGGEKVQAGVETDMMLTDDLLVTLGLGLEGYKYNGVNEEGDEGMNIYGSAGFDYRVTMQDLISGSYSRTGNNETYKVQLLHTLTDTLDWTIGYMYANNFEGIGSESKLFTELMYHFGGNSRVSEKFDRATKSGKLTLNDIRAIRAVATDQIQIAKKELTKKVTVEKKNKVDAITVLGAPTLLNKTNSTLSFDMPTFTDDDGVKDVVLEVSLNTSFTSIVSTSSNGSVSELSGNTSYTVRGRGQAFNNTTQTWETKYTPSITVTTEADPIVIVDEGTTIGRPNAFAQTNTTINVGGWVFTDDDGVQNVTVNLYSDVGLTNLVQTTTDGRFSGLTPSTRYFAVVEGDAKNGVTGLFEHKKSSALIATTFADPVIEGPLTVISPTVESRGLDYVNLSNGTFTDVDGVRNVTVELYSDSGCTSLIGTSTNGDFSGLTENTTYYALTSGEHYNIVSGTWSLVKSSTPTSVTTLTNTAPVISGITSTGSISLDGKVTNLGLEISDDNVSNVTWSLSVEHTGSLTGIGTFTQQSGTGNTLKGITFDGNIGGGGRTITANIVDGEFTRDVIIYSN